MKSEKVKEPVASSTSRTGSSTPPAKPSPKKALSDVEDETARRDRQIGIEAEREAVAQLAIIRALKPLSHERRQRVLDGLLHLLAAETCVPGIFALMVAKARGESDAG